jgi:hypothetical protein
VTLSSFPNVTSVPFLLLKRLQASTKNQRGDQAPSLAKSFRQYAFCAKPGSCKLKFVAVLATTAKNTVCEFDGDLGKHALVVGTHLILLSIGTAGQSHCEIAKFQFRSTSCRPIRSHLPLKAPKKNSKVELDLDESQVSFERECRN